MTSPSSLKRAREWIQAHNGPMWYAEDLAAVLDAWAQEAVIEALRKVNAEAEADILLGNPITGAHHRAIEKELEARSGA
jgi:hypothetical protein